jgi:hypothetical protein
MQDVPTSITLRRSALNPANDNPVPESPESRPRLGDLLLGAGLISPEQLEESLILARTAGKPLGHVLVEQGLVPAHSLAMALADQHGGPLKTEFGFATGRGSTPRPTVVAERSTAPALRLAAAPLPEVQTPEAPLPEDRAEAAEATARLQAEARAIELLAGVEELESDLAAERAARAADAAALATVREELAAALVDAQNLRATLSAQSESHGEVAAALETVRARVTELEAAAQEAEATVVLTATVDELQTVIELQEQALAIASARELASTRSYSHDTHFLFAPSAEGYELLERSGPSPAPGQVVELSGGRSCRVLRVSAPPFPGATEACAYLDLV